jgi:hypothetical protein
MMIPANQGASMDGNFTGIYQADLIQAQYQKRFGT